MPSWFSFLGMDAGIFSKLYFSNDVTTTYTGIN